MDPSGCYLCVISEDQREEYEAEFARLTRLGVDLVFEASPERALSRIGELRPRLVLLGTEIEDYEGIELLSMIMNKYKEFDEPVVVLPEKEDGLPPMLHSRSLATGKSQVKALSFEDIIDLVMKAQEEPPAAAPAPAPLEEPPVVPAAAPGPAERIPEAPPATPEPVEEPPEPPPAAAVVVEEAPHPASPPSPRARSSRMPLVAVAIGAVVVLVVAGILFVLLAGDKKKPEAEDGVPIEATSPAEDSHETAGEDQVEEQEEAGEASGASPETASGDPLPSPKEITLPIFFGRNRSIPKITDHAQMASIVESLKQQPEARIVLTGYASSEGEAVDNYKLAMDRAESVMELLVKRGIPANRFELKSLGANEPATSNETEEGRAENRRVSLLLLP